MCSSTFTTKDDRKVIISIDDSGEKITVTDQNGLKVGEIELQESDGGAYYHIIRMHLDDQKGSYRHQGIGRQALKFHKEIFQAPLTTSNNDGIRKDDGSHLTGDAPEFIAKMRAEGIVESCAIDSSDENDD